MKSGYTQYVDEKILTDGQDRRKQVSDHQLKLQPNNCIGLIVFTVDTGKKQIPGYATGTLISSCLVLTSAHSFYFIKDGQILSSIPELFYLTVDKSLEEKRSIKVTNFRVCSKYLKLVE